MAVMIAAETIKGVIHVEQQVSGKMVADGGLRGIVFSGQSRECKSYSGTYDVVPKTNEQILDTYDRHMDENLTIRAIPYAEVTNNSGGKTVSIGGN